MDADAHAKDAIFVYVVTPNEAVASKIARKVVEDRLAACGNIMPGMKAVYRWQGRIEEADEVVLILKTTRDRFDELNDYVKLIHPYDVPCIVALPLVDGDATYLKWILDNSQPAPERVAAPGLE